MKYPRTKHLPISHLPTSDDKVATYDELHNIFNKDIIVTEKLDGENTCLCKSGVYARSHTSETRSPWSRNLWDENGLYWKVKDLIGEDEYLYGENLYGIHSIEYNNLPNYWHLFAVRDDTKWYSWNDVKFFSDLIRGTDSLEGNTVPELWRGQVTNEYDLNNLVLDLMGTPSTYGSTKEGVVIRLADEFNIDDFSKSVFKYVRANHVQTNEHWTKNWKPAKLKIF